VVVGVLKGVLFFLADLLRATPIHLEVDFMAISSYSNEARDRGIVRVVKDLDISIENRHVLFVEDVIDTGLTLNYLLKNLNTRETTEHGQLQLKIGMGKYASVNLEGAVLLNPEALSADLKGKIDSINLAEFSQYAERYVGYRIKNGMFESDLVIKVTGKQLDSVADLRLNAFQMEPVAQEKESELTNTLDINMPINAAEWTCTLSLFCIIYFAQKSFNGPKKTESPT